MFLCMDIGGTALKYALFDNGEIIKIHEIEAGAKTEAGFLGKIYEVLERCPGVSAVGIASGGFIDSGVIMEWGNMGIRRVLPAQKILSEKLSIPVFLENDVNAAAMGEARFGAGVGYKDFICLAFGTGIGAGIFANGAIYKGRKGLAGEAGHFTIHPGGIKCTCGGRGCYERYASTSALVAAAAKKDPGIKSGRDVFAALNNPSVREAAQKWAGEAALGIASLIHILAPEAVILGGGIMNEDYAVESIAKKTRQRLAESFKDTHIKKALLGGHAAIYGMFALLCDKLL